MVAKVALYHEFLQMPYPAAHNGRRHSRSYDRMACPLPRRHKGISIPVKVFLQHDTPLP